jgi:hypothetical protein
MSTIHPAPQQPPAGALRPKILVALFLLAWLTYASFTNGLGNPNTTSRVALAVSLGSFGEVSIDRFANLSEDQAFLAGHYYSDKAPGMSFLALPVVAATETAYRRLGGADARPAGYPWVDDDGNLLAAISTLERVAPTFTSGALTALEVVALYVVAVGLTGSPGAALFAALVFAFATPAWGWATTLFGHSSAGAFLFFAFAIVHRFGGEAGAEAEDAGRGTGGRHVIQAALAGLAAAAAITVEYTTVPAVYLILLYALWQSGPVPTRARLQRIGAATAAGLVGLAPLLAYHTVAFGTPLTPGYTHVVGFDSMSNGAMGIGTPDLSILARILVGERRGLLWLSPILLLSPLAIYAVWRRGLQSLALLLSAIGLSYFLLNSGYAYWEGGWSTGPRHVTPSLGFLCLPFAVLWDGAGRRLRIALMLLCAISVVFSLACVSVTMTAGWDYDWLLWDRILPSFLAGDIPAVVFAGEVPLSPDRALLPGLAALAPVIALWAIMASWLARNLETR